MSENTIGARSLKDLLSETFFIPDYQRGYRWTKQQVLDLLNDLYEFTNQSPDEKGFYCMQPLVVKENPDENYYEVVDGQQRLTTFYLLLKTLSDENDGGIFEIKYHRANELLTEFVKSPSEEDTRTTDLYHLSQAYTTIRSWLELDKDRRKTLCELLYEQTASCRDHNVRFIWYEIQEQDPIKVFTRLNIGKISLTNAELIKALLLNQKNFSRKGGDAVIRLRQQEIASEWDEIERRLQRPDVWLFLHNKGYMRPTRIDFIFELIVAHNDLNLTDENKEAIGSDRYKTFRYFYTYFNEDPSSNEDSFASFKLEACWAKVKEYYQTFMEWYDDLELYHYVGYLLACGDQLLSLWKMWCNSKDKIDFLKKLKAKIYDKLSAGKEGKDDIDSILDYQYHTDGSNKTGSRVILLFHNIQTAINRNLQETDQYEAGTIYRFPFHLYKSEAWDVEHINSSSDNSLGDIQAQKEWLVNVYLVASKEDQDKISAYFNKSALSDEERNELFKEVRAHFSEPMWTEEQKNQIGNYALLDSSTNRSYGNAIFSAKRRIIIEKDKGYLIPLPSLSKDGDLIPPEEEPMKATSSFVPLCTKAVFMKYYSPIMGDSNYWTIEDAEDYKADIKHCIEQLKENDDYDNQ